MATYTVDTISDSVDAGDGVLSLREALALADATEAADTILFADAVQGRTIVLAGSQLTVNSDLTIDGGSGVTIDADQRSRVLDVGRSASLAHLTLTGGRTTGDNEAGGGISALGFARLALHDVTVGGNSTAGAGSGGGGIFASYLTLVDSVISGNSTAGDNAGGGGILGASLSSRISLTNSTVSGNSTFGDYASGGGIRAGLSGATLINCTVSGNITEGDHAAGGGVYSSFDVTLSNSIVVGNTAASSTDPDIASPSIRSNGSNVFGSDVSGGAAGDLENVPAALLFAVVDPTTGGGQLADNGGSTQTIALRDAADNPALAGADPADSPVTDQRGVVRPAPAGTNPDIGAFELDQSAPPPAPTFLVTTTSDVSADDGVLTLREALALADADPLTRDRIGFAPAVQGQTIVLDGGQLTAGSSVMIDGGSGVTIDADERSRVLLVQGEGTDVTLAHLTVSGGRTTGDGEGGGGIYAAAPAHLALYRTMVSGNSTAGRYAFGGGVSAFDVTLTASSISGNGTTGEMAGGGGISAGSVTLIDSTVSDNIAVGAIGGIGCFTATITNSTISGNRAVGNYATVGGISASSVFLTNSTVTGNSVSRQDAKSGGIYAFLASLANSIVAGNTGSARANFDVSGFNISSNGHNIFGSDVEGHAPGDREGVPASRLFAAIDPITGGGQLGDNGGPTRTVALRDAADNPALAGADPIDSPLFDQRRELRPQPDATSPDIGAFELNQTVGEPNEIVGTDRGEFLSGTPGADIMRGLGGDDRLWGRPGDDVLFGDAGADVLAGKPGIDQMTGGAGADRFLFRRVIDAPPDGPSHDEILDFARAEHDRIDLTPIDANRADQGNQSFRFIGEDASTRAGQLRYEATADGDFLVSGNTDRDLAPDFAFIVRTDLAQLREGDFLL